jgi:hypothetical protein
VATSTLAKSESNTEDDPNLDKKGKGRLAPNGRYVVMEESGNRSEKGVDDMENVDNHQETAARTVPLPHNGKIEFTRTLYDFPRDPSLTPQYEMYRRAHPSEISEPTEFTAYLRDAGPVSKAPERVRFTLPTVEESVEALHALHNPKEMESKRPTLPRLTKPGTVP